MILPHSDLHRLVVAMVKQNGGVFRVPMADMIDHDAMKNDLVFETDQGNQEVVVKVRTQ